MATDSDTPKSPEPTFADLQRTVLRVLYLAKRFEQHNATILPDSADDRERALLHRNEKRVLAKIVSEIDELYAGSRRKIDAYEFGRLVDSLTEQLKLERKCGDWKNGRERIADTLINDYFRRMHSNEYDERIRQVLSGVDEMFLRNHNGPRQAAEAILGKVLGYQARSIHNRRPEQAKGVDPLADEGELWERAASGHDQDEEGGLFEYVLKLLGLEREHHAEAVDEMLRAYQQARLVRDGPEATFWGAAVVEETDGKRRQTGAAAAK